MMKTYQPLIKMLFLLTAPCVVHAGWEVSTPQTAYPREPFFQDGPHQRGVPTGYSSTAFPNLYANLGQPAAVYAISVSGSVKENIERIMGRYHWRVIWKSGNDYNFDGKITGASLPNVIEKLLKPFPLQAVMYMSNRTLLVTPRPEYRV